MVGTVILPAMRRSSQVALVIFVLVVLVGAWAAYYAQGKGFTHRWRNIVTEEFEKRGIHASIRRLTLDPLRGLIAKDVMLYEDPAHEILLMRISQIALDINLSDLEQRRFTLRAFEIRSAAITIPLDPVRKLQGEQLVLDQFSARVLMPPDQIEIVRAEAFIHGVGLRLSGSLFRPPSNPDRDDLSPSLGQQQSTRLSEVRQQRELIANFLKPLQEISFPPGSNPRVDIQVQGDTANLRAIRLAGALRSGPFRYRTYSAESLAASLRFERDSIIVRELELRDGGGKLQAEFELNLPKRDLRFQFTSSIDAFGLLKTMVPDPALNELVFYEPPLIESSGVWHLSQPFSLELPPLQAIGSIRAERATSRGVIFEAMSANFSFDKNKLYLRDGKLEHKTGVLTCDIMRDEQGVRFRSDIRLHPTVFAPFLGLEGTRQFLKRWTLTDQTAVFINLEGHGPTLAPESWVTTGVIDLRNCGLNQHPIDQLQCDLYFEKGVHNFYNVVIRRPEGEISGQHIQIDHDSQLCRFRNVRGKVFPAQAVGWFAPEEAANLLVYDFATPPQWSIEGTIDTRLPSDKDPGPLRHDYTISFAGDSTAHYPVVGKKIELVRPSGTVVMKGDSVHLRGFKAEALEGTVQAEAKMDMTAEGAVYEVDVQLAGIDFEKLARIYGSGHETGGELSGRAKFHSDDTGLKNLRAEGLARVERGNIFCLPTFGPLSKPLAAALPRLHDGFNMARQAELRFRIRDGKFIAEALEAETGAFNLKGEGTIGMVDQALALETTVNIKGPAGALLVPVAKLLEFEGTGTLEQPVWRTKTLGRVKDATLGNVENITQSTLDALRKVGGALPKRLSGLDKEPVPPVPRDGPAIPRK
jgi:hypothetical protein